MVDQSFATMSTPCSTSPSHLPCAEKKHWWLTTKKMVDKYVREAGVIISTRKQTEMVTALSQLDAALTLSPRYEPALELKARCLLHLGRYKDVADMLQDYIPSHKMAYSEDSSGSSSDNSSLSRERVKLLGDSEYDSPSCDYPSFKCFSIQDLKKKLLCGLSNNCDKQGQWRYLVLGEACSHLGLMEDAIVLLQHGKRLASAASRRQSICWSDDSFSLSLSSESDSISPLISHIKLLLRRRAAALASLDAALFPESIRHFSKILDSRRPAPPVFLADCYFHRSAAFKSAGRIADSIADLNRTLALDPSSTPALLSRAGLFELIGCITDAVHDLEHVKLIYNSILRDRKPPGPIWKPPAVSYGEIPARLCGLVTKIQELKQRIAMGDTGKVDYHALMGLRRGCSRSELDRAHLLLLLKHKPEKSIGFIDRCEFADEGDFDSVKDRARMSASLLHRLIQKGYSNLRAAIAEEEAAEIERKKEQAQAQAQKERSQGRHGPDHGPSVDVERPDGGPGMGTFPFQGVFCRDLAAVGSLLSQVRFNRPLSVKYEALSC